MRVFSIDDARNGRKMHPDVLGNIFQHHRLNVLNPLVQEIPLPVNDRFDDAIDRLPAVFNVAKQVDGGPHLLFNKVAGLFRCSILRQRVIVVLFQLFDIDLRSDQDRLFRRVTPTGERIEGANELQFSREALNIDADLL